MTAACYTGNGQLEFRPCEPCPPQASEVRIEVAYGGVCGSDLAIYHGHRDDRMQLPSIIGHEMSGTIAEVGCDVDGWQAGDRVAVLPLIACGRCHACNRGLEHVCERMEFFGVESAGAFQDSWTVPTHTLHRVPDSIAPDQAALVEPLAVAMHAVRTSGLQQGHLAIVLGGGPIGLLTALTAQYRGGRVLLSEVNPFRLDLARDMGLEVVDARSDDLDKIVAAASEGAGADIVFEASGSQAAVMGMSQLLCVRGLMLIVAVYGEPQRIDLMTSFKRELRLQTVRCYTHEDFDDSLALIASGKYPLERMITDRVPVEALASVFEQMETGAPVMKTLLEFGGGSS